MTTDKTGTLKNARMCVLEARNAMDRAIALIDMVYYASEKNEPGRATEGAASIKGVRIASELQSLVNEINRAIREIEGRKWAIYTPEGVIDCDPEPMIFCSREIAVEVLQNYPDGYYVAEVVA